MESWLYKAASWERTLAAHLGEVRGCVEFPVAEPIRFDV